MEKLKQALEETGYDFRFCAWRSAPDGDYGTYFPESGADLVVNNVHLERGTVGYVDYFTRDPSDTPRNVIEAALNESGCGWSLNSVQFEEDTLYIHYEWMFRIYG